MHLRILHAFLYTCQYPAAVFFAPAASERGQITWRLPRRALLRTPEAIWSSLRDPGAVGIALSGRGRRIRGKRTPQVPDRKVVPIAISGRPRPEIAPDTDCRQRAQVILRQRLRPARRAGVRAHSLAKTSQLKPASLRSTHEMGLRPCVPYPVIWPRYERPERPKNRRKALQCCPLRR